MIGAWLATDLLLVGRNAESYAEIDRALDPDSTTVPPAFMGAYVALARGQRARARALADLTWRPNGIPRPVPWAAAAAQIYAGLGDTATIRRIARVIDSGALSRSFGHSARGSLALVRGDTSRALDEWSERLMQESSGPASSCPIRLSMSSEAILVLRHCWSGCI